MAKLGLKKYFLTGLFVLLPIGASALIVTWLFNLLDHWAAPLTQHFFGRHIPGLGLIIFFVVVVVIGVFSSNVVGKWFLNGVDHLLREVPIFKTVYGTTKQVMDLFSPDSAHRSFQSVVVVEHPHTGSQSLGFVTRELRLGGDKGDVAVAVYVPTNHLYLGDTFLFKPAQIRRTPLTVQQGIQCVVTAGASLPENLVTEPYQPVDLA